MPTDLELRAAGRIDNGHGTVMTAGQARRPDGRRQRWEVADNTGDVTNYLYDGLGATNGLTGGGSGRSCAP